MKPIRLLAGLLIVGCSVLFAHPTFQEQQNAYPRVRSARARCEPSITKLFDSLDIAYPPYRILIRGFKHEQRLELWAQDDSSSLFTRIKNYPFTGYSGVLGPKRRQGDLQIPEGFYQIVNFNPWSEFHLSLRLDYPNKADSILGKKGHLGGQILIHGMACTIGCIPIGNDAIEELYIIGVDTRSHGQTKIPVYIFPCKMDSANMTFLAETAGSDTMLLSFWRNLKTGYDIFDETRRLLKYRVDPKGVYIYP